MTTATLADRVLARTAIGADVLRRDPQTVVDAGGFERSTFRNRKMELFVWTRRNVIKAFELHHQINTCHEWSILWVDSGGVSFHRVDARLAMIPIDSYRCPVRALHSEFVGASSLIEEPIRRLVLISLSNAIRRCFNES